MPTRCINKVQLLGNITRDPELRYTPGGMAVASFGIATNRIWTTKQGEKKEDAQFHRIVAWNKLAELCAQLLKKGTRVLVEGRIQYREFTDQAGVKKQIAEIVIDDMVLLNNKAPGNYQAAESADYSGPAAAEVDVAPVVPVEEEAGALDSIIIPDEDVPSAPKKDDDMPF